MLLLAFPVDPVDDSDDITHRGTTCWRRYPENADRDILVVSKRCYAVASIGRKVFSPKVRRQRTSLAKRHEFVDHLSDPFARYR